MLPYQPNQSFLSLQTASRRLYNQGILSYDLATQSLAAIRLNSTSWYTREFSLRQTKGIALRLSKLILWRKLRITWYIFLTYVKTRVLFPSRICTTIFFGSWNLCCLTCWLLRTNCTPEMNFSKSIFESQLPQPLHRGETSTAGEGWLLAGDSGLGGQRSGMHLQRNLLRHRHEYCSSIYWLWTKIRHLLFLLFFSSSAINKIR